MLWSSSDLLWAAGFGAGYPNCRIIKTSSSPAFQRARRYLLSRPFGNAAAKERPIEKNEEKGVQYVLSCAGLLQISPVARGMWLIRLLMLLGSFHIFPFKWKIQFEMKHWIL